MNEFQARGKWCPFTITLGDTAPHNRNQSGQDLPPTSNCIASRCLMWEFDKGSDTEGDCMLKRDNKDKP